MVKMSTSVVTKKNLSCLSGHSEPSGARAGEERATTRWGLTQQEIDTQRLQKAIATKDRKEAARLRAVEGVTVSKAEEVIDEGPSLWDTELRKLIQTQPTVAAEVSGHVVEPTNVLAVSTPVYDPDRDAERTCTFYARSAKPDRQGPSKFVTLQLHPTDEAYTISGVGDVADRYYAKLVEFGAPRIVALAAAWALTHGLQTIPVKLDSTDGWKEKPTPSALSFRVPGPLTLCKKSNTANVAATVLMTLHSNPRMAPSPYLEEVLKACQNQSNKTVQDLYTLGDLPEADHHPPWPHHLIYSNRKGALIQMPALQALRPSDSRPEIPAYMMDLPKDKVKPWLIEMFCHKGASALIDKTQMGRFYDEIRRLIAAGATDWWEQSPLFAKIKDGQIVPTNLAYWFKADERLRDHWILFELIMNYVHMVLSINSPPVGVSMGWALSFVASRLLTEDTVPCHLPPFSDPGEGTIRLWGRDGRSVRKDHVIAAAVRLLSKRPTMHAGMRLIIWVASSIASDSTAFHSHRVKPLKEFGLLPAIMDRDRMDVPLFYRTFSNYHKFCPHVLIQDPPGIFSLDTRDLLPVVTLVSPLPRVPISKLDDTNIEGYPPFEELEGTYRWGWEGMTRAQFRPRPPQEPSLRAAEQSVPTKEDFPALPPPDTEAGAGSETDPHPDLTGQLAEHIEPVQPPADQSPAATKRKFKKKPTIGSSVVGFASSYSLMPTTSEVLKFYDLHERVTNDENQAEPWINDDSCLYEEEELLRRGKVPIQYAGLPPDVIAAIGNQQAWGFEWVSRFDQILESTDNDNPPPVQGFAMVDGEEQVAVPVLDDLADEPVSPADPLPPEHHDEPAPPVVSKRSFKGKGVISKTSVQAAGVGGQGSSGAFTKTMGASEVEAHANQSLLASIQPIPSQYSGPAYSLDKITKAYQVGERLAAWLKENPESALKRALVYRQRVPQVVVSERTRPTHLFIKDTLFWPGEKDSRCESYVKVLIPEVSLFTKDTHNFCSEIPAQMIPIGYLNIEGYLVSGIAVASMAKVTETPPVVSKDDFSRFVTRLIKVCKTTGTSAGTAGGSFNRWEIISSFPRPSECMRAPEHNGLIDPAFYMCALTPHDLITLAFGWGLALMPGGSAMGPSFRGEKRDASSRWKEMMAAQIFWKELNDYSRNWKPSMPIDDKLRAFTKYLYAKPKTEIYDFLKQFSKSRLIFAGNTFWQYPIRIALESTIHTGLCNGNDLKSATYRSLLGVRPISWIQNLFAQLENFTFKYYYWFYSDNLYAIEFLGEDESTVRFYSFDGKTFEAQSTYEDAVYLFDHLSPPVQEGDVTKIVVVTIREFGETVDECQQLWKYVQSECEDILGFVNFPFTPSFFQRQNGRQGKDWVRLADLGFSALNLLLQFKPVMSEPPKFTQKGDHVDVTFHLRQTTHSRLHALYRELYALTLKESIAILGDVTAKTSFLPSGQQTTAVMNNVKMARVADWLTNHKKKVYFRKGKDGAAEEEISEEQASSLPDAEVVSRSVDDPIPPSRLWDMIEAKAPMPFVLTAESRVDLVSEGSFVYDYVDEEDDQPKSNLDFLGMNLTTTTAYGGYKSVFLRLRVNTRLPGVVYLKRAEPVHPERRRAAQLGRVISAMYNGGLVDKAEGEFLIRQLKCACAGPVNKEVVMNYISDDTYAAVILGDSWDNLFQSVAEATLVMVDSEESYGPSKVIGDFVKYWKQVLKKYDLDSKFPFRS